MLAKELEVIVLTRKRVTVGDSGLYGCFACLSSSIDFLCLLIREYSVFGSIEPRKIELVFGTNFRKYGVQGTGT